jgi:secreted trypsin-like serine protease
MLGLPANVHLCNGVVISGKYVLTPASCIYVPGVLVR